MDLVEHARRELELCGQAVEDPDYTAALVAAVAAFTSYGHSGGSAEIARQQLHTLLGYGTLSPLTDDPDEWLDVSGISGEPLWQSRRDPTAFSTDGGQTHYLLAWPDRTPKPTKPVRRRVTPAPGHTPAAPAPDADPDPVS